MITARKPAMSLYVDRGRPGAGLCATAKGDSGSSRPARMRGTDASRFSPATMRSSNQFLAITCTCSAYPSDLGL